MSLCLFGHISVWAHLCLGTSLFGHISLFGHVREEFMLAISVCQKFSGSIELIGAVKANKCCPKFDAPKSETFFILPYMDVMFYFFFNTHMYIIIIILYLK